MMLLLFAILAIFTNLAIIISTTFQLAWVTLQLAPPIQR